MEKIKCGDANPNGNVQLFFKGGCKKDLQLKDAYRCTGCGGFFHLDCIFKHFEEEKNHDYAHKALRVILNYSKRFMKGDQKHYISSVARKGLMRKLDNPRVSLQ